MAALCPSESSIAIRLLDTRIDLIDFPGILARLEGAVSTGVRLTILYVNVHCMNVRAHDSEYARILERADLVYCDGTGVQLAARIEGLPAPRRLTGADWIDLLCGFVVDRDLSLYLLAGREGVASRAADVLRARHPGLRVVGTAPGYGLTSETVAMINAARPDILLVGMGTPTQERWIAGHRDALHVPVVWAVGALFDFVTGEIPRGPRWMTQHGLEWVCRLAAEPRKLWRRYLIGNPTFLLRTLRHRLSR